MQRKRTWLWIVGVALVGIVGVGVTSWRLAPHYWLRHLAGDTLVLEIDADHPYDDGLSRDEAIRRTYKSVAARAGKLSRLSMAELEGTRLKVRIAGLGSSIPA